LIADNSPYYSDLSTPYELFISDVNSVDDVFLVNIYDNDPDDIDLVFFSRLDTLGVYFQHSIAQNATHMQGYKVITYTKLWGS